ncbi:MAG: DNA polymerase III subunit delta [Balneolales bacterium]|nr:DNA polymerase III subunit delta [Balneolales bacterium]
MAKKSKPDPFAQFQQAMQHLDSGNLKSVYFICGDEQFFIDQIQEKILSLIPEESKSFNFDMLYGNDVDTAKILDISRSYPMMVEKRFVLVREFFQSIEKKVRSVTEVSDYDTEEIGASALEPYIPYFKNPVPSTVLVLTDSKKPNKKLRFYKAMAESNKCIYLEFDSPAESQIPGILQSWLKLTHNKELEPRAAIILLQIVGNSLHKLTGELSKICTFDRSKNAITEQDVKKLAGFSREYSAFELQSAIFAKDIKRTMFIAERILQGTTADTGEVIRMIALLQSSFSNIWQYKRLQSKRLPEAELSRQMNIRSSFRLKMIARDSSRFSEAEMPRVFEALYDADRAIKGFSKLDTKAIFVMMLQRIIA